MIKDVDEEEEEEEEEYEKRHCMLSYLLDEFLCGNVPVFNLHLLLGQLHLQNVHLKHAQIK